jgi:hypothetical protein
MAGYFAKLFAVGIGFLGALSAVTSAQAPATPMQVTPAVYTSTQSLITPISGLVVGPPTTTAPSTTVSSTETCTGWVEKARQVGWPEQTLPTLAVILRRESACQPAALGDKDKGGSYGLLQVHCPTWGTANRYNEIGWLQARGIIETCEDLFEPITNLVAGLLIWHEAKGFGVWSTYDG